MRTERLIQLYVQCDMGLDRLRKHDASKYDDLINEMHDMQHQIQVVFNDDVASLNDLVSERLNRIGAIVLDNYDIMEPCLSENNIKSAFNENGIFSHKDFYDSDKIRLEAHITASNMTKRNMQTYSYIAMIGLFRVLTHDLSSNERTQQLAGMYFVIMHSHLRCRKLYLKYYMKYNHIFIEALNVMNNDLMNGYPIEYARENATFKLNTELMAALERFL